MDKFAEAYGRLNEAQRRAVDTLDGPVLVIAGPGTGKTQLLTTRIANILAKTDTAAANILCLTFTESAAQTMRERLANFIGQEAYDVTISTYHAFGSDLIRRFPDYFSELADTRPVDDLGADSIFREIVAKLPYGNPLKFADNYVNDVRSLVSDAKRALLAPDDLRRIAKENLAFIAKTTPVVQEKLGAISRLSKSSIPLFAELLEVLGPPRRPAFRLSQPFPPGEPTFEPVVSKDRFPAALRLSSSSGTRNGAVGQDKAPGFKSAAGHTVLALVQLFAQELAEAVDKAEETGKTTALTAWKNAWLAKDGQGAFVVDGERANHKLLAAADIYADYLNELKKRNLFDYDDMILRAVHALETNADLRFTLQERYLYILLDEFQDTNAAQLRLVELLTDNPVHEGRPNVLAVGDDDQAIYAFQGADYSHMLQFQRMYRDVLLVPLTQNYRSHADVLHVARGVAEQIEERLHHHFPAIEKTLSPAGDNLPKRAVVERREAKSDVAQFAWTAAKIRELIDDGLPASDIAVLAPQHKHLEPLVAFLQQAGVPLRYEKRENVLDDPTVNQLLRMAELCLALANQDRFAADSLWPEILSFDFWQLPTSLIWELSWRANDRQQDWSEMLFEQSELRPILLFFVRLGLLAATETVETMLDYLIGVQALDLHEPGIEPFTSPFYAFYFAGTSDAGPGEYAAPSNSSLLLHSPSAHGQARIPFQATGLERVQPGTDLLRLQTQKSVHRAETVARRNVFARPDQILTDAGGSIARSALPAATPRPEASAVFWELLTNLVVLRARLREYKADDPAPLKLADLLKFAGAHRAADIKILNTSPYQDAAEAVQLLTAFKAKGQEYAAVFVLAVNDEAWGGKAQNRGSHISIPANLQFIRYAGTTDDERRRLFYVAVTRAKSQLYLVNYTGNYAGKTMSRLKYLNETSDGETTRSPLLPDTAQVVLPAEGSGAVSPTTELGAYWQRRHAASRTGSSLTQLLAGRLQTFQLSATHLSDFTDIVHGGPEAFFLKTILRFPLAPRPEAQFGNAMHETLEWIHLYHKRLGQLPAEKAVLQAFGQRLRARRLQAAQTELLLARGTEALHVYLAQRGATIAADNQSEVNFRNEGVFVGPAHLGGKIDKLVIDKAAKTIAIVDYKTGRAHSRWTRDAKLHRYEQQLYFYKLLVEGSHTFASYTVTDAYLEFVEPDEHGKITELHLSFDDAKLEQMRALVQAVWRRVTTLELPSIDTYTPDLAGIETFEHDLLMDAGR